MHAKGFFMFFVIQSIVSAATKFPPAESPINIIFCILIPNIYDA